MSSMQEIGSVGIGKENTSDQLAAELQRMNDLIEHLEVRLITVLEPLGPETMVPSREPKTVSLMSPLRDRIYFLGELNSRLNMLLERIDL